MIKFATILIDKEDKSPVAVCEEGAFKLAVLEHIPQSALFAITKTDNFDRVYKVYSRQLITYHELAKYMAKEMTLERVTRIAMDFFYLYSTQLYTRDE